MNVSNLAALILVTGMAFAIEAPTSDLGKKLFEAPALSSNGLSCSSCHSDGQYLQPVSPLNEETRPDRINDCIREKLQGRTLAAESQEMDSLLLFLETLAHR